MSDIASLYVEKVNRIYDNTSDLHVLAKDIADSFKQLSIFRAYIACNVEIINQFRNISGEICQFIDCEDIYKRDISLIFDQIKEIKALISQIKNNNTNTKHFFYNEQKKEVAEIEKLIEDCFNNLMFSTLSNFKTELETANKRLLGVPREYFAKFKGCISVADENVIGLRTDGTVVVHWSAQKWLEEEHRQYPNIYGPVHVPDLRDWKSMTMVSIGGFHAVGLRIDGTVSAAMIDCRYGLSKERVYDAGQCKTYFWNDIIAIAAGYSHTVGLKSSGTVDAVGCNKNGQCNTSEWRGIIAIAAGRLCTVGLKANGTVISTCSSLNAKMKHWRNIVAISSIGLIDEIPLTHACYGLKTDGTVVSTNDDVECKKMRNIVAISGKYGLKANGTVVSTCSSLNEKIKHWRDIVAIADSHSDSRGKPLIGLKADGTTVGMNWSNIGPVNKEQMKEQMKEEKCRIEQQRSWKSQGLCRNCGGQFSGFFSKTCKSCGKAKDY